MNRTDTKTSREVVGVEKKYTVYNAMVFYGRGRGVVVIPWRFAGFAMG